MGYKYNPLALKQIFSWGTTQWSLKQALLHLGLWFRVDLYTVIVVVYLSMGIGSRIKK